ncbi:MAG: hypothetical protein EOO25_00170 [Comamonadaceae bacterium]|nr:MAG: hypothetical protein EOO25_00170 [Comamonadaceae bacterium]
MIEAPLLSATGDPRLARLDPDGPNRIFVRSAQIRTLTSIDLPALNGLSSLLGAVTAALSPVTNLLNNALSLNLSLVSDLLGCALACTKNATDIDILPPPLRLDVNLDVGGGESRLTDFSCDSGAPSVTARTTTQAAAMRIGKMGQTAALARTQVFSSSLSPHVDPVPVIDIGAISCTKALFGLVVSCAEPSRQAFAGGGLGLKSDTPVAASTHTQFFANPPRLDAEPVYDAIATSNMVQSLSGTFGGLDLLQVIPPTSASGSGLSAVLTGLTTTLSDLIGLLRGVVSAALAPLLDPLLNTLIRDTLGINLAQTEVGARMNCASGAELVY